MMIDAWIVEEIREKKREGPERPCVRIPLDVEETEEENENKDKERGIVTISMWGDEEDEET